MDGIDLCNVCSRSSEFVESWNSHLIRQNHLSACPSGVPNELYEFSALYITGATDYSKEFPVEVWLAAMVSESEPPASFYSDEFKEWADYVIMRDFYINQAGITHSNCRDVYLHLLGEAEE